MEGSVAIQVQVQLYGAESARTGVLDDGSVILDGVRVETLPDSQIVDLLVHGLVRTMHGNYVEIPAISQAFA